MKFVEIKGRTYLKVGALLFTLKEGQRARARQINYNKQKKKTKKTSKIGKQHKR